jgi:hypothetical protein
MSKANQIDTTSPALNECAPHGWGVQKQEQTMSRRVALSTLASAVPAAIASPSFADSNPDAGLVALGAQWDAIEADAKSFEPSVDDLCWERELDIAALIGVEAGQRLPNDDARKAYADLFMSTRYRDANDACVKYEAMIHPLDRLTRTIMARPARSAVGLAIKARTVVFWMSQLWDEPEDDLDWHDRVVRQLVEEIYKTAGVPLPEVCTPDDEADDADTSPHVLAAAALDADPIFAAIERYRQASDAYERACNDPEAASTAQQLAAWGLVETQPTTIAGLAALFAFVSLNEAANPDETEFDWSHYEDERLDGCWYPELMHSLARATAKLAAA